MPKEELVDLIPRSISHSYASVGVDNIQIDSEVDIISL